MPARQSFEMTEEQLQRLYTACRPVPYIVMGGVEPRSQQANANDAWESLGLEMGFDAMTVQADRRGDRFFTAEPLPRCFRDGDQWCAVGPGFVNLQESPAGFGDTPIQARRALVEPGARKGE